MAHLDPKGGSLHPGALVGGRFKIERLIGRGGMGEVYSARHAVTGREVALKIILGAAGADADHTRRFLREAKAATAIQHPSVIEVFDVFEDSAGSPVMVMELLKGETLSALRKRVQRLSLTEMASILLPVASALRAAHDKGIVHRDLKPENIFLADVAGGVRVPKVLDFGIAKVLDPTQLTSETQGGNTSTGSILGTPQYMSYEQAMSDKTIDHRADIWSLGVIAFELLVGRRPLVFTNLGEMYRAFLQGTVPSLRDEMPELPDEVTAVIDRCLQRDRDTRLADLGPLVEVLERHADPNAIPAAFTGVSPGELRPVPAAGAISGPAATTARTSRRTPLLLAGAAVMVLGGGAGLLLATRTGPASGASVSHEPAGSAPLGASLSASASTGAPAALPASALPRAAPPPSSSASTASTQPASTGSASPPPLSSQPKVQGRAVAPPVAASPPTAAPVLPASTPAKGISDKLPY